MNILILVYPFAVFLSKKNCWIKGMYGLNFDRPCQIAFQEDWPICISTNYERVPFVHFLINNGECQFFKILAELTDNSMVLILICLCLASSKADWSSFLVLPFTMATMKDKMEGGVLVYFFFIEMTIKTVMFWATDPYKDAHVNVTHFHVRKVSHNWTPKVK